MPGIYPITQSIKFFQKSLANGDKQKKRNAGNLGSEMNESEVSQQFILIGTPVDSVTAENNIALVIMSLDDFGKILEIKEGITDYGSKFFANKSDKKKESEIAFGQFWGGTR
jgi:hypothetical protein